MVRFKHRQLISYLSVALLFLIAIFLVFLLRNPATDLLRFPLKIFAFLGQEFKAIVLFNYNYYENKRLSQEVANLKQKFIQLEEASLENNRLKKALAFKQESPQRLLAARVIARDPSYWDSVVIIDKGRKDGIGLKMIVICPAGLVGRVIETGNLTSRVMLLNDPEFNISAVIQRSREEGLVSGKFGNRLIMHYLPTEADLAPGDIVITSGFSAFSPKGILIGKIAEIGKEFSGLSLYCLIKPAVDFNRLEEVLVVSE